MTEGKQIHARIVGEKERNCAPFVMALVIVFGARTKTNIQHAPSKGTGVITNPITWQEFKCPTCNGKHVIETTCKDCNNTRKCQKCSGIGVQSGAKSCANCAGSGRVDCPSCE